MENYFEKLWFVFIYEIIIYEKKNISYFIFYGKKFRLFMNYENVIFNFILIV